jgi:hypothetical protein
MMLQRTRKQTKRQPMAAAAWCLLVNRVSLVKRGGVEQGFSHLSYTSIPGSTRELANPEVDL